MELKSGCGWCDSSCRFCFNRTFMELKLAAALAELLPKRRFNRTFMELKSGCGWCDSSCRFCFNRTFMELKLAAALAELLPKRRFNRTFMELKFSFRTKMYLV